MRRKSQDDRHDHGGDGHAAITGTAGRVIGLIEAGVV
jgi:hypothetical protein